jgi:hypothetical protein
MSRLRTLAETYVYIKEMDTETAVTSNALRRMVVSGYIPCVKVGKKYLIDIDTLFDDLKTIRPEVVLSGYKNPLKRL